ncbi:hypothetical protein [Aureivirga sp. CE67]|uniref:hypothetical protein n=1 Tax=Aureivirga sp. CE67 TaxID=1788983 RepID=UPI0018C97995|nr:hypothetical protein [Aureivirga sp. CE67]
MEEPKSSKYVVGIFFSFFIGIAIFMIINYHDKNGHMNTKIDRSFGKVIKSEIAIQRKENFHSGMEYGINHDFLLNKKNIKRLKTWDWNSNYEFRYDKKGRILERLEYSNRYNSLLQKTIYKYNEKGQNIELIKLMKYREESSLNASKIVIEDKDFDKAYMFSKYTFSYDKNGNLIERKIYKEDMKTVSVNNVYEYENDRLLSKGFKKDGVYQWRLVFDEKGNPIENFRIAQDGVFEKIVSTYDDTHRILTKQFYFSEDGKNWKEEKLNNEEVENLDVTMNYIYEYYENGYVVEKEVNDFRPFKGNNTYEIAYERTFNPNGLCEKEVFIVNKIIHAKIYKYDNLNRLTFYEYQEEFEDNHKEYDLEYEVDSLENWTKIKIKGKRNWEDTFQKREIEYY